MTKTINVLEAIRKRYPANEYALMQEVSNAAGSARNRSADFVIMGLWNSRGLPLIGIELKSFRSDWLSELKKPQKAEEIFKYCDYFYLLTTDEVLAKMEEIPDSWGWLAIVNGTIKVKKEAPKQTPVALNKSFVSCMLRRAVDKTNYVHYDNIEARVNQAHQDGKSEAERHSQNLLQTHQHLQKQVADFQNDSGIRIIDRWGDRKKIGKIVEFINSGGAEAIEKDLQRLKQSITHIYNGIERGLESLESNTEPHD